MSEGSPLIYFVHFPEVGVVKIGYTTNLNQRLSALGDWLHFYSPRTGTDITATERHLLMTISGSGVTFQLERALHYRYRKHLAYGHEGFKDEWVLPTIATLDPKTVLEEYLERPEEPPMWEDEVTERFPVGFVPREHTSESIAYVIKANREWRDTVRGLWFGCKARCDSCKCGNLCGRP
jgi:hypothetical protein